jgi:muramoyltetrapeptide carboxypeptidase
MFADPSVKAILAIRGGWGCARLLPYLDWGVIRANPKLLAGFSDITALHLAIAARGGFPTIHGPNIGSDWGPQSLATFRQLAFEAGTPLLEEAPAVPVAVGSAGTATVASAPAPSPRRTRTIRPGRATGRLLGGNLTVLAALVGTQYLPSFAGAILFIEDVGEAEYRVDRMLTQLALAGHFRQLAGVVFGQCTRCATSDPGPESVSLDMVLDNHFWRLGIPAFTGAWFGHISNQLNIPVGVLAEIDADAGSIRVLEPAVA